MHIIQKQIMQQLIYKPSLRFSQIKPPGLESNHFMYHLNCLLRGSYVLKKDAQYGLSAKGRAYADRLSLKNFKPRIQPKIVTLVAVKNSKGEHLVYRRNHQPFIGLVGFPYGKIHLEEAVLAAAQRELYEKTSLTSKLRHCGDAYITVFEDGQLLSQMLAHIFTGSGVKGTLQNRSIKGKAFWAKVEKLKKSECMPGFLDIYKTISQPSHGRFFKEFVYNL